MIVSVMYPVGPGQKFDTDYYMKSHIPLVNSLFGPLGLKHTQVLQGTGSPSGDPAGFLVIALLDFESAGAFKSAVDAHGAAVFGDIPKFTDVQPAIQFNDRLA